MISLFLASSLFGCLLAEEASVLLPNKCESCVIFAREFENQIASYEKGKSSSQKRDELTLVDALEKQCEIMLKYKVHKEKNGLERFSKSQSQTMRTLRNLKDRGVKVELGMPDEMWDQPSAEITFLKQQCELILEEYEDVIERWYNMKQRKPLQVFLCKERLLRGKEATCLKEDFRLEL